MREEIKGFNITTLNYEELIKQLFTDIENKQKKFILAVNPEKIMSTAENRDLLDLYNKADYQIPDGGGILRLSKKQGGKIRSRVTGCDLFEKLCEEASYKNKKIYLYGAKPGVAERTKSVLENRYNNLKIVGVCDGYEKDENKIINDINEKEPDLLFVAKGSPSQEKWITENMDKLNCLIFQGVGGSFDVISGDLKRAPRWMREIGLEWLYRVIKEPKRIGRIFKLILFMLRK